MKNSTLCCLIQVSRYQQGFPGAIKFWGTCFLGGDKVFHGGFNRFGENHNFNCFVHNGKYLNFIGDTTLMQVGS